MNKNNNSTTFDLILDSKLITATNKSKIYNYKLVQCGEYMQIYEYQESKLKSINKKDFSDLELIKIENKKEKKNEVFKSANEIEEKNIIRSKLQCQRIAKCNMKDWKSFVTLTFAENIQDIKYANKKFHSFITLIKRHYKDFKYLCVPEFQKRGAIHYHLLTNIDINDSDLMYTQEDNSKYKHIKYWNNGFNSVEQIKNNPKKVVGYISKYMTKDIDNRLFGFRRFFYSQNCEIPKVSFIDSLDSKQLEFLKQKIQDKEVIYQNEYINPYDNSYVTFLELQ